MKEDYKGNLPTSRLAGSARLRYDFLPGEEAEMNDAIDERVSADTEGLVVFLIGMRINRFWKIWKWLPVILAMPRMLKELEANPHLGLLSARLALGLRNQMVVQHWKSVEHLHAYAHSSQNAHLPAWQAFNRNVGVSGDVGIWHETYVVPEGDSESVYVNMPRYGLGAFATLVPAKGDHASAAKRLARKRGRPKIL